MAYRQPNVVIILNSGNIFLGEEENAGYSVICDTLYSIFLVSLTYSGGFPMIRKSEQRFKTFVKIEMRCSL